MNWVTQFQLAQYQVITRCLQALHAVLVRNFEQIHQGADGMFLNLTGVEKFEKYLEDMLRNVVNFHRRIVALSKIAQEHSTEDWTARCKKVFDVINVIMIDRFSSVSPDRINL